MTQRQYWDSIDRVRAFLQFASEEAKHIQQANRWTYIGSGMTHPNFSEFHAAAAVQLLDQGIIGGAGIKKTNHLSVIRSSLLQDRFERQQSKPCNRAPKKTFGAGSNMTGSSATLTSSALNIECRLREKDKLRWPDFQWLLP